MFRKEWRYNSCRTYPEFVPVFYRDIHVMIVVSGLKTRHSARWVSRGLIYLVSLMICIRFVAFLIGLSIILPVVFPHVPSAMTLEALKRIKPFYITAVRITEVKGHWPVRWTRSTQYHRALWPTSVPRQSCWTTLSACVGRRTTMLRRWVITVSNHCMRFTWPLNL